MFRHLTMNNQYRVKQRRPVACSEDASWTGLREAGDTGWLDTLDAELDRPGDKQALLDSMLARESQYSRSAAFFWRLAKASHLCGLQMKPGRAKEELARQGIVSPAMPRLFEKLGMC